MVGVINEKFILVGSLEDVSVELMMLMEGLTRIKCDEPDKYNIVTANIHMLVKEDDKAREIVLEFLENMHDIT